MSNYWDEYYLNLTNGRTLNLKGEGASAPSPNMSAGEVLAKAKDIIAGKRTTYQQPERLLTRIAEAWSLYLGDPITYTDVALMMVLLKVIRAADTPENVDHYVDIAGYAALAGEAES